MPMQTSLSCLTPSPRVSSTNTDAIRQRALERLYERHEAVTNLIASLEDYQRSKGSAGSRRAECIDISVGRKYWSGSAQSRI